jgi:hypothetical protein
VLAADQHRVQDDPMARGHDLDADPLLAGLGRDDPLGLAASIAAAQQDLIDAPLDALLLVRGGPGTARTPVTLRRAARLARDGTDVLVVGPTAAYTRWAAPQLPDGVALLAADELGPPVRADLPETPQVARLKGDRRMAALLNRAVQHRRDRLPAHLPAAIIVDGELLEFDREPVLRAAAMAHAGQAPPDDRRRILSAVLAAAGSDPRLIRAAAETLADLLWPGLTPAGLLRDLLAARETLTAAAGTDFTADEIESLHDSGDRLCSADRFGPADLALLDELAALLGDPPQRYGHVLLDEAQDLSPMRLRAVARRSATGSMTVAGDLAQSTGPWAHDDWAGVLAHLPATKPMINCELTYGYRVPRRIFDLAAELLPASQPGPAIIREGAADPRITPVEPADRTTAVLGAVAEHAAAGRSVGVICPARWRAELAGRLGAGVSLLSPYEAKGLEFDAVVVVEPGDIVDDDPWGQRLLYVALTRTTGFLHLIGAAADLPLGFPPPRRAEPPPAEPPPADPPPAEPTSAEPSGAEPSGAEPSGVEPAGSEPAGSELDPAVRDAVDMLANRFAETLLATLDPQLWPAVLARLAHLIRPLS